MAFFPNKISDDQIGEYITLAESGRIDEAIENFIKLNVLGIAQRYANQIKKIMARAEKILPPKEIDDLSITITSYTTAYTRAYSDMFAQFVNKVYTAPVFKLFGISSQFVRKTVKAETISQFKKLTKGTLRQTNRDILKSIRSLQTDMIAAKRALEKMKSIDGVLKSEIAAFQKNLQKKIIKKNPDFFKMKENEQFIKYSNGRMMPLESYSQMATRTTLLNVERKAVEVNDKVEGRRISGYILRDNRSVNMERDICKHVLSKQFYGMALLAHDQAAADVFGIRTIEGARGEGAMGPNCRHSLISLSDSAYNTISSILYLSENQVV